MPKKFLFFAKEVFKSCFKLSNFLLVSYETMFRHETLVLHLKNTNLQPYCKQPSTRHKNKPNSSQNKPNNAIIPERIKVLK